MREAAVLARRYVVHSNGRVLGTSLRMAGVSRHARQTHVAPVEGSRIILIVAYSWDCPCIPKGVLSTQTRSDRMMPMMMMMVMMMMTVNLPIMTMMIVMADDDSNDDKKNVKTENR